MNDEPTEVGSVIDPWHESFYEALRDGDATDLPACFAGDAVFMPPYETTVSGANRVREWFESYMRRFTVESFVEKDRHVSVMDKMAIEWGAHSVKLIPKRGGPPFEDEIRFLHVWQLHPGDRRWRLSRMMWNSARPLSVELARLLSTLTQPPTT